MNDRISALCIRSIAYLFLGGALIGCHPKTHDDDQQQEVKAVVSVKVDHLREHDALLTVSAHGKTDALRKEKLYSPIAGKIVSLTVFEGTPVHRGEVIAIIQSKESNAAILGAESMARSAATQEQKNEAARTVELAHSTQNSVNVVAKFDGIVSTRSVSEGELVVENAELVTLIDLSTVDFLADVLVHDLSAVRLGQRAVVTFSSIPQQEYPAIVDAINPQTDIQSQTVKVRFHFVKTENSSQPILRTDIVGTVNIEVGVRHQALFVPKAAVLRDDENNAYSIVSVTDDSLAKTIPVSIGTSTDSTIEIFGSGLRAGMPVIIEGNYSLADSTRITRQD